MASLCAGLFLWQGFGVRGAYEMTTLSGNEMLIAAGISIFSIIISVFLIRMVANILLLLAFCGGGCGPNSLVLTRKGKWLRNASSRSVCGCGCFCFHHYSDDYTALANIVINAMDRQARAKPYRKN